MSFQGIKQTQEDREMLTAIYGEGWIIERELVLGTGENMGSKCVLVMKEPTGCPRIFVPLVTFWPLMTRGLLTEML